MANPKAKGGLGTGLGNMPSLRTTLIQPRVETKFSV